MKITVDRTSITIMREQGDPKFHGVRGGKGESSLFHFLKRQMATGHPDLPAGFPSDWIKKRMWKDGHMVDQMQQYLRTRRPVGKAEDGTKLYLCLYNGMWAVNGAETDWNEGSVRLTMAAVTICTPELSVDDPHAIAMQSRKVWEQVGKDLGSQSRSEP